MHKLIKKCRVCGIRFEDFWQTLIFAIIHYLSFNNGEGIKNKEEYISWEGIMAGKIGSNYYNLQSWIDVRTFMDNFIDKETFLQEWGNGQTAKLEKNARCWYHHYLCRPDGLDFNVDTDANDTDCKEDTDSKEKADNSIATRPRTKSLKRPSSERGFKYDKYLKDKIECTGNKKEGVSIGDLKSCFEEDILSGIPDVDTKLEKNAFELAIQEVINGDYGKKGDDNNVEKKDDDDTLSYFQNYAGKKQWNFKQENDDDIVISKRRVLFEYEFISHADKAKYSVATLLKRKQMKRMNNHNHNHNDGGIYGMSPVQSCDMDSNDDFDIITPKLQQQRALFVSSSFPPKTHVSPTNNNVNQEAKKQESGNSIWQFITLNGCNEATLLAGYIEYLRSKKEVIIFESSGIENVEELIQLITKLQQEERFAFLLGFCILCIFKSDITAQWMWTVQQLKMNKSSGSDKMQVIKRRSDKEEQDDDTDDCI